MTPWPTWEATWRVHAQTAGFRRHVNRAVEVARSGARHGQMFCSLSGGKDSVALAGICCDAGLRADVPLVHAHTDLDLPDTLDVVRATADVLDMDLEIVEPDAMGEHVERVALAYGAVPPQPPVSGEHDAWSLLATIPRGLDITDPEVFAHVLRACGAGNMMVAYSYAGGWAGSYVGLRGEESRSRAMYQRAWGPEHRSQIDGTWQVCPLLAWSGDDVYAYLLTRGLPIHPYYRRAYELLGGDREPGRVRVDLSLVSGVIAARGALTPIAKCYPVLWRRLVAVRPELARYV